MVPLHYGTEAVESVTFLHHLKLQKLEINRGLFWVFWGLGVLVFVSERFVSPQSSSSSSKFYPGPQKGGRVLSLWPPYFLSTNESIFKMFNDTDWGGLDSGCSNCHKCLRTYQFWKGGYVRWAVEWRLAGGIMCLVKQIPFSSTSLTSFYVCGGGQGKLSEHCMMDLLVRRHYNILR